MWCPPALERFFGGSFKVLKVYFWRPWPGHRDRPSLGATATRESPNWQVYGNELTVRLRKHCLKRIKKDKRRWKQ